MKSEFNRFTAFMIFTAVILFVGGGVWAYLTEGLKEYLIILGVVSLVYGYLLGGSIWVGRGK